MQINYYNMDAFWKFNVQENPINYMRCEKVLPGSQKHYSLYKLDQTVQAM